MRLEDSPAANTHGGVLIAPHSPVLWTPSSALAQPQHRRMYLIYTVLALAEVCVFLVSAVLVLFFILRGIIRLFRRPEADPPAVAADTRHLKRAGAGQSG
jgi:hypothetical protein